MSLLEDIFLQDEANEAQELERVIEDDGYDERPRNSSDESDNEKRDDEADEEKRRVDPTSTKTKRVTKNPRFILNPARLTGPRGIKVIPEHFKDFRFKGKGHEKEDLDMVLKKLEHWAYRLYPKFQFQDCLKKIETLGKKRPVMVHLHKIRTDQFMSEDTVVQKDSSDDEAQPPQEEDEFDKLLQQQIELARATPAPGSVKKGLEKNDQWSRVVATPNRDDRFLPMPKATSSPSISDEQKERMLRNRKLAEERRLARLKVVTTMDKNTTNTIIEIDENEDINNKSNRPDVANNIVVIDDEIVPKKVNKTNVIDSSDSDDECNVMTINESIVVDVHSGTVNKKKDDNIIGDGSDKNSVDIDEINDHGHNVQNIVDKDDDKNIDDITKGISDESYDDKEMRVDNEQNDFNTSNITKQNQKENANSVIGDIINDEPDNDKIMSVDNQNNENEPNITKQDQIEGVNKIIGDEADIDKEVTVNNNKNDENALNIIEQDQNDDENNVIDSIEENSDENNINDNVTVFKVKDIIIEDNTNKQFDIHEANTENIDGRREKQSINQNVNNELIPADLPPTTIICGDKSIINVNRNGGEEIIEDVMDVDFNEEF